VSNASELFPDPDTPLTTVSLPCGISQEMFFRLWVRAPRITIASFDELKGKTPAVKNCSGATQTPQRGSGRNRPFFIIKRTTAGLRTHSRREKLVASCMKGPLLTKVVARHAPLLFSIPGFHRSQAGAHTREPQNILGSQSRTRASRCSRECR
jgi:hypothetical protein